MLSRTVDSSETVHAARVCACPSCKHIARLTEDAILASLAFDLSYDALRRTDAVRLEVAP